MWGDSKVSKQVSAILCSDLHLREDTPICRTDDYKAAQAKKVEWLQHLADTHCCPILCAGDVFDNWNISAEMATWAIENMPTMYAIPGQHDLPSHNLELIKKPSACIEYVLVHEFCHLIEEKHNDAFLKLMDKNMPKWRMFKDELNKMPLAYEKWSY